MENVKISLDVVNSSEFHNLGIELSIDDRVFFDNNISAGSHRIIHEISDQEKECVFKITLKNKTAEHTKIDPAGEIISDALIEIKNLEFDGINVDQLLQTHGEYIHDVNGTGDMAVHKFYGKLGCNGTVALKFTTPVYQWLLDNL